MVVHLAGGSFIPPVGFHFLLTSNPPTRSPAVGWRAPAPLHGSPAPVLGGGESATKLLLLLLFALRLASELSFDREVGPEYYAHSLY
ncbi:hypothetical protein E2C01_005506 [Portunus trituberculatus]|uniref:Uncharacterized protein n=1 Tax=Portunus trituberculatus TaxID=210409 RepID=A0A5B7CSM2_PORTR|nr:hypothetical protein [Portunus trituberculatus]